MTKIALFLVIGCAVGQYSFGMSSASAKTACALGLVGTWKCDVGGGYYDRVEFSNLTSTAIDLKTSNGTTESDQSTVFKRTAIFDSNAPFEEGEKYTAECHGSTLIYQQTQLGYTDPEIELNFTSQTNGTMSLKIISLAPMEPHTLACVRQ